MRVLPLAVAASVVALGAHGRATAQVRPASVPLAAEHWAYEALERLGAAGLLDGAWLAGERPLSEGSVAAALRAAAARGRARSSPLARFAAGVLARFAEEYPFADSGPVPPAASRARQQVAFGLRAGSGGPAPERGAVVAGRFDVRLAGRLAVLYEPELRAGGPGGAALVQRRALVAGRAGAWWAFAGRERFRWGPGAGGGLVLTDGVAFDGVALGLEDPVRLPGPARVLGPLRATLAVSVVGGDTLGPRVVFGAARLAVAPLPALQIGLNRTTIVAGQAADGRRIGVGDVARLLVGVHTRPDFDDDRASVDLRVRADVARVPIVAYVELGFEDTAGAITEDPALVSGLYLPVIPGLPGVALRYEYAAFGDDARFCWYCEREPRNWYRHGHPRAAYASEDGVPYGHPLGGYGREHRVEARAWLWDARLRLGLAVLSRDRGPGNLLYGWRPGASRGAGLEAAYLVTTRARIEAAVEVERGRAGWRERAARVGVRAVL